MPDPDGVRPEPVFLRWKLALVLALGVVAVLLLLVHVDGVNGPRYWQWPWRRLAGLRVFPMMAVAALPFAAACWLRWNDRLAVRGGLALLGLSALLAMLAGVGLPEDPFSLVRLWQYTAHPLITSYFTDAATQVETPHLLADYHELLPSFHLHTQTKPPGPVLFHGFMIRLFGVNPAAALAGGVAVGLLATLTLPATYWLARVLGADRDASFMAACIMGVCPGFLLFLPELDQVYALFACLLLGGWVLVLRSPRAPWALAWGALLFVASFQAYNLLVLGVVLGLVTLLHLRERGRDAFVGVAVRGGMALLALAVLYALLASWTGFRPVDTFQVAVANQAAMKGALGWIYPNTVPFALLDFALGMGWLPLLLAVLFLVGPTRTRQPGFYLACAACLLQVVVVALTGLMPSETARVWIFLMPLVALAAGHELSRWPLWARGVVLGFSWLIVAVMCQNLAFISL